MQKKNKIRLLSILMLSILIGQVGALDLIGNVSTSAGVGISGATVQIVGGGSTTTNATGYYNLTGQAAGNYTAYAVASGYYRDVATVELTVVYNFTSYNFTLTSPNYTVSDMDDIMIDLVGVSMVEVKNEVPTLMDLVVLWLILSVIVSIVVLAASIFLIVPRRFKSVGRGRTR